MNANLLKSELVKKGKNVTWLSEQLGYSTSNLYKKLNGESEITVKEANTIRKALDMNDELVRGIFFDEEVE